MDRKCPPLHGQHDWDDGELQLSHRPAATDLASIISAVTAMIVVVNIITTAAEPESAGPRAIGIGIAIVTVVRTAISVGITSTTTTTITIITTTATTTRTTTTAAAAEVTTTTVTPTVASAIATTATITVTLIATAIIVTDVSIVEMTCPSTATDLALNSRAVGITIVAINIAVQVQAGEVFDRQGF